MIFAISRDPPIYCFEIDWPMHSVPDLYAVGLSLLVVVFILMFDMLLCLQGCLPLVLMFDMKEETDIEQGEFTCTCSMIVYSYVRRFVRYNR